MGSELRKSFLRWCVTVSRRMWSELPSPVQSVVQQSGVPVKVAHADEDAAEIFPDENVIVTGVVERDGEALFVRSTKDGRNWEFPGGRMESGEEPQDTVIREVEEETGYQVEDAVPSIVLVWSLPNRVLTQVVFAVSVGEQTSEPVAEIEDVEWFESLPKDMTFDSVGVNTHRVILENMKDGKAKSTWRERLSMPSGSERKLTVGVVAAGVAAGLAKRALDK